MVLRQEDYAVSDVIAFRAEEGIVIHRIVGGSAADGYLVQGESKLYADPWQPKPAHIA